MFHFVGGDSPLSPPRQLQGLRIILLAVLEVLGEFDQCRDVTILADAREAVQQSDLRSVVSGSPLQVRRFPEGR